MSDLHIPDEAYSVGWHELRYPRPATDEPGESFKRAVRAAAPIILAAELRRLGDELKPVRDEWREVDDRTLRSSAIGHAIDYLIKRATELDGGTR